MTEIAHGHGGDHAYVTADRGKPGSSYVVQVGYGVRNEDAPIPEHGPVSPAYLTPDAGHTHVLVHVDHSHPDGRAKSDDEMDYEAKEVAAQMASALGRGDMPTSTKILHMEAAALDERQQRALKRLAQEPEDMIMGERARKLFAEHNIHLHDEDPYEAGETEDRPGPDIGVSDFHHADKTLHTSQDYVFRPTLEHFIRHPYAGEVGDGPHDERPSTWEYEGQHWINGGHHRILSDRMTRRRGMEVSDRTVDEKRYRQGRPGLFGEPRTAARDLPCEDCHGTGRESYRERSWDCRNCGGSGTFRAADSWEKPKLLKEQQDALDAPERRDYDRKSLDLARHPVPGTQVWRGEVRHKDDIANPTSVGMHWTVKPEQAILGNGGAPEQEGFTKDHRHVLWQGTVEHSDEQAIPRSHPIWHGRHRSMDSEAEVRFRPGARVHLNGAYVWDAEGNPKGRPHPRNPDRTKAGWSFHPLDHHVTVEHHRPADGLMGYQTAFPDLFGKKAKAWMPSQRIFGPTHGLDHRLFDGDKLKPDVRAYILGTLDGFWRPLYGPSWRQWARVHFAGSEASEWTSETLEGNNDFDVLIGVDYDRLRSSVPAFQGKTNEEITSELNAQFRDGLDPRTDPAWITIDGEKTGPWSNTWYVNADSYDIRAIRPYAAYDVGADQWIVRPPHLPDWDVSQFPEGKGLTQEIQGVLQMARGILKMPEPYRTQQGAQFWHYIHDTRSRAFGPQGEGWYDPSNVVEKALDQAGLLQDLWSCMDRARQDPSTLDAPAAWSNNPLGGQ